MNKQYTQLRIWKNTLKKLRRIYAETGESMIAITDRLATQEVERLNNAGSQNVQIQTVQQQKE